jgi:hypothetical protein
VPLPHAKYISHSKDLDLIIKIMRYEEKRISSPTEFF